MELSRFAAVIFVICGLAAVLLFTPYEAYLEGILALGIIAAAVTGSVMHPRREVFYVRTAVRLIDLDRNQAVEHDYLAVKVELVRLWLWVVPTSVAVVILVFFAAGGPTNFSFLNWMFSSRYSEVALILCQYPPLLVLVLLSIWISERRVMRDAEACSATSFRIYSVARGGWFGRVAYSFRGEHGEYYGGDCSYFGFAHPRELASTVFHNSRKPDLNKIAMGFIFHRFTILGRGVTDLDKQTASAQAVLIETLPVS
jgi:hypothetical protein